MLHIRKLPNEASETEVIALGLPFGKVTNILTLKGKNQVSGRNKWTMCILRTNRTIVKLQFYTTDSFLIDLQAVGGMLTIASGQQLSNIV